MTVSNLQYVRLAKQHLDAFFELVVDAHIKRYLFDGHSLTKEWCDEAIAKSAKTFEANGVGLWLVRKESAFIGFCGFWTFEELGPELQIVYALSRAVSGKGLATKIGQWLIDQAKRAAMTEIVASVDAPNVASIRVLEKLGFKRSSVVDGALGELIMFRLSDLS